MSSIEMTAEERAKVLIDWLYGDTPSDSQADYEMLVKEFRDIEGAAFRKGVEWGLFAMRRCDQYHCGHESCNKARSVKLPES